ETEGEHVRRSEDRDLRDRGESRDDADQDQYRREQRRQSAQREAQQASLTVLVYGLCGRDPFGPAAAEEHDEDQTQDQQDARDYAGDEELAYRQRRDQADEHHGNARRDDRTKHGRCRNDG